MEPIKQEIINNIFENGDKLITGPILQTVLIDMIDDVNGKDQEILSKTGSWDNAVTQIPNLATKEEVTNLSESVARDLENVDLTGYATEQWVESQGYLKEHQDISNLATKTELTQAENNLQGNITSLSESVARDIANVSVPEGVATETWVQSQDYASKTYVNDAVSSSSVDLTGYATETWVQSQGYLTEHQDISGLATKTELNDTKNNLQGNITSLSESVARDIANVDLTGYATETWVQSQGYLTEHQDISNLATKTELNDTKNILQSDMVTLSGSMAKSIEDSAIAIGTEIQNKDYASKTYVDNAVSSSAVDLTGYATEQWVQNQGYLKEHQDISGLATKTELTSVSESVQTDITNLSESVANSAVWKKGTGTDSIAQKLTGANETNTPTATGTGAVAIGSQTTASVDYSHAEGDHTNASGWGSHAEGSNTNASGDYSHAEGDSTNASELASHAEGAYTEASGQASHAEGMNTNASELASHAEGAYTNASGWYSHAEGMGTITNNPGEHAQGIFNHSSVDQIFSVGAGDGNPEDPSTATRRNAISVIAPWDNNTGMTLPYFFVKGVGSYNGTNPEPGINDLATVINDLPSGGGGSSETLWKKGEGQGSIVQKIASGTDFPTATGTGSVAIGWSTLASGDYSHAEGKGTIASGSYSHVEGNSTKAEGSNSHAEGTGTNASGECSHAEGQNTKASGQASHAEGWHSIASGSNSHAEGYRTEALGSDSHAEGKSTIASGSWSHAEGTGSKASGESSHAEGYKASATGRYSHAEGYLTLASGEVSHAEGSYTTASGESSHAEGNSTKASGSYSHAEGAGTEASGLASHAEGGYTIASNACEHAQGRYNHSSTNQIFSIGTGNSSTDRRNAVSVLEVSNNNSYTSSFFVQNIGGYDGTNPTPGTNDLATVINGMSTVTGEVSSIWKKGTGTDSIVQVIAGGINLPTATGTGSVAIGSQTTASGQWSYAEGKETNASNYASHAEGKGTKAEGLASHAEGRYTTASSDASHAEGSYTVASNQYEHAQGRYNHSSTDQIFSIGTGNSITDRRNAVSVLEVSNNNSYTSSFFVQNIGGYDGTNPIPGTNDLATVINGLSSSGGSSETLWEKGTGKNSIVQVIADGIEQPNATGERAVAIGDLTRASGFASHAEGYWTEAKGNYSHAEGRENTAEGVHSHTEGFNTIASNSYEHAQGIRNYSSTNQIFSVGAGDYTGDYVEASNRRRNAISVLAVPNADTQVVTASFFVQNVGGYDGTNPTPGTNDLATVINGLSSGGGIGTSSETWTFTLDNGSTVTKTVVIA